MPLRRESDDVVLESDAAYNRFGIKRRRRDPLWGAVPHAALEIPAASELLDSSWLWLSPVGLLFFLKRPAVSGQG